MMFKPKLYYKITNIFKIWIKMIYLRYSGLYFTGLKKSL